MVQYDTPTGIAHQALEREGKQIDVVDLTEEWDKVGKKIHWRDDVSDRGADEQLVDDRHPAVGQETGQEAQIPRQLPDVVHEGPLCALTRPQHGLQHLDCAVRDAARLLAYSGVSPLQ
jgi:hypothetical protein